MSRHTLLLIIAIGGTLLLGACGSAPSASNPTAPASVTATVKPATPESTLSPEEMPTAVPLSTATPTASPTVVLQKSPEATPLTPTVQNTLPASAVAVVNGTVISQTEFEKQYTQARIQFSKRPGFEADSDEGREALQRLKEQVRRWMIDQVLIEEAAKEHGIRISEQQIDRQIASMKGKNEERFQKWLSANGLTEETLREQVRMDLITAAVRDKVMGNLSRTVPQVHVRHILFSEESQAQKALRELQQGANFIATARKYSEDEATRQDGGDLGFMPKGVMPPEFEEAAFSLEPGETSDIIHTGSGLHIIQVVEKDPQRRVPDKFWPTVQQRAFENWLAQRRAKSTIHRNVPSD